MSRSVHGVTAASCQPTLTKPRLDGPFRHAPRTSRECSIMHIMSSNWQKQLAEHASDFAEVALANIGREYPHVMLHTMTGPDDRPQPRDINPAFYGSFDWHSCVEMYWLLIRLLRTAPEQVPEQ